MSDAWFFDVLPCHPEPYEGECLSGYLLRLANVNGITDFRAFICGLFPEWGNKQQVRILRWEYPTENWGDLPQRTQLPVARLTQMTLLPWVAKFRTPPMRHEGRPFYPGQILRDIVRSTLQVCPLCLQEKPYIRLLWRLQPVTACVAHGCWLQGTCHACGQPLPVVSNHQRHLHCGCCGADLRQLPVVRAPDETLAEEDKRQPDWDFLLDPTVSLVNEGEAPANCELPRVIGLKLRYFRYQTGHSAGELARQSATSRSQIKTVEHGWQKRWIPLATYLLYLAGLRISWQEFASVRVPPEFFSTQLEPQFMSLRICPTPDCPNHQPPPGPGVILRRQLRERELVVLKCKVCKRKFTRTYTGELVTKYRHPPLPPEIQVNVQKPEEEIEQVRQLGLQGRSIRHITRRMGWGKETVRNCWLSLGIAEEVRTAQKQRWRRKSQKFRKALWAEIEEVLDSLCQQDTPITLTGVTQALGRQGSFIFRYPDIASRTREVITQHNAQLKQRRFEELEARIRQVIAGCHKNDTVMSIRYILEQANATAWLIQHHYPQLWDIIREVVAADKEQRKAQRLVQQRKQIDEAAVRLTSQSIRLTKKAIIEEARKVIPITWTNPQVDEALDKWVGDFAPSD